MHLPLFALLLSATWGFAADEVKNPEDLAAQFATRDTNGDGKLSEEEFIAFEKAVLNSKAYKPDILLLNCGLHDLNRGKATNKQQQYQQDLEAIIALAKAHHVPLVWVQTTPKGDGEAHNPLIVEFN